jgi:hypothetical protein
MPGVIALSTGPLVFAIQQWVRPALSAPPSPVAVLLGVAPNLVTGLCFPFASVMRPSLLSKAGAASMFTAGCIATLLVLLMMEWWRPIAGAQTFDIGDVAASIVGVALSLGVYRRWVHDRLRFRGAGGASGPPSEPCDPAP